MIFKATEGLIRICVLREGESYLRIYGNYILADQREAKLLVLKFAMAGNQTRVTRVTYISKKQIDGERERCYPHCESRLRNMEAL